MAHGRSWAADLHGGKEGGCSGVHAVPLGRFGTGCTVSLIGWAVRLDALSRWGVQIGVELEASVARFPLTPNGAHSSLILQRPWSRWTRQTPGRARVAMAHTSPSVASKAATNSARVACPG